MNKALHEVEEKVKVIDVVIELFDARAPKSSVNEHLEKVIQHKKKLYVFTKADLADPEQTSKWQKHFRTEDSEVLVVNVNDKNSYNSISNAVTRLGKTKWAKEMARGMKPQPIRTMIIGIPNVGKSSLINLLAKRKAAGVQNKPGYTRGEQWIRVNKDFLLLDTPGILPMSYENQEKAANLALVGSIREDILPNNELVSILLKFLKEHYPTALKERFGIENIGEAKDVLEEIANKRGLLAGSGRLDILKAESLLLKEFKDGLLGRISLEWL
jgi:ribosome biogenesis GTPase A